MRPLLIQVTLVMVSFNLLLTVAVMVNRFLVTIVERRRIEELARVRPHLLAWIDGDDLDLRLEDRRALTDLVVRYGRVMHGDARIRLAKLSQELGIGSAVSEDLGSRRGWKRAAAAFRLGDLGAETADDLVVALTDPDRRVRNAAARSLGRLQAAEAVEALVLALAGGSIARAVAGQALLDIGSAAAPRLEGLLGSHDPGVRAAAVELLGRLAVSSPATLNATVTDESPAVRVAAARAFARMGTRSAEAFLVGLLEDPVAFVRAAAATAIAELGLREQVPRLLEMAQGDDHLPASAAAAALGVLQPDVLKSAVVEGEIPSRYIVEAIDMLEVRR